MNTREIAIFSSDGLTGYETRSFTFPGGELQVRVPGLDGERRDDLTVFARIQSSDDLMRLVLATDILDRHFYGERRLVIPYFPYARQDRVMQPGEAFSLKAVARIINSLGYDQVVICDPHSDVTPALVDNVRVISQVELIRKHTPLQCLLRDLCPYIISPDAGAAKKAFAVAKDQGLECFTATKVRDVRTGEIAETRVDDPLEHIMRMPCLIVDDICDGGRTFVELAKVLRDRGAKEVYLYVTHGIFSKGLGVFEGLIDGIFTTDSFLHDGILDDRRVPVMLLDIKGVACQ